MYGTESATLNFKLAHLLLLINFHRQYLQIQLNPSDPHFIRLNAVLANIPLQNLTLLERFVDLHDPGEEIEDGWGSDEPVSLITDEEDGRGDEPL